MNEISSEKNLASMQGRQWYSLLGRPILLLIVILVMQIMVMGYYVDQKKGYHVDEIFSLTQANGMLDGTSIRSSAYWFNHWNSSDYYWAFLTVQYGERFEFKAVYNTISQNVHPPFYHLQLHAAHSLFPNTFNKKISAFINIFWLVCANIMLYFASRLIIRHKYLALLPSVIWGFSAGAISNAVFFRPYATLTFFFTALILLAFILISGKRKVGFKFYVAFALVFFFGFFTHMYFIVFFVLVAVLLLFWLIYSKEFRQLRNCIITILVAFTGYILIWPYVMHQIFSSKRGVNSFDSFLNSEGFLDSAQSYFRIIDEGLFGNKQFLIIFIIVAIVLAIANFMLNRKAKGDKKGTLSADGFMLLFLLFVTVVYVILIARIAPYLSDRYVFAVYPSIILLFIAGYYYFLSRINSRFAVVILIAISIFVIAIGFVDKPVNYLFKNRVDVSSYIQNYDNPSLVVLQAEISPWNRNEVYILDFVKFDRTFICRTIDDFSIAIDGITRGQELFLYIDKEVDVDEVLTNMYEILPYQNAVLVYTQGIYGAYHIEW